MGDGVKGLHTCVYTACEKHHSKDVSMSGLFNTSIRLISMAMFSQSVRACMRTCICVLYVTGVAMDAMQKLTGGL